MILIKHSQKHFEFQWLQEIFFRDQQSQRSNVPKLSFWTHFDSIELILDLKTQKHHYITFWILKCKLRVVWACWLLCLKDMILRKPSSKKFELQWVEKTILRDQQSQRSNLPKLSFWTDFDWNGLILDSKREFWKIDSLTLLVSQNFFSGHWNSKFFREGFVRIISFEQSNQHTHTTHSLHFGIHNVIQWCFLNLETK